MSPNVADPGPKGAPTVVDTMLPKAGEPPLPDGWEMGVTEDGDVFYIDHVRQLTTWEDPRKSGDASTGESLIAQFANAWKNATPEERETVIIQLGGEEGASRQVRQQLSLLCNGPLPIGWEQSATADGEPFFIDHFHKKTSWVDPRLRFVYEMDADLPDGWEEAIDGEGFVYYIDHKNKKTQRENPRSSYSYSSLGRLLRLAAGETAPVARKAKRSIQTGELPSTPFVAHERSRSFPLDASTSRQSGLLRMLSAPSSLIFSESESSTSRASADMGETSLSAASSERYLSRQCGAAVQYLLSVVYSLFGYEPTRKEKLQGLDTMI